MSTRSGGPTDRGPGRRAGEPISRALIIPPGPPGAPIRAAVAAIDRVHGDGSLPLIAVRRLALPPGSDGLYDPQPPAQIVVAEQAPHPALTVLHEIGHVLDHHGVGSPGVFSSAVDPSLTDWRDAVRASQAFAELARLARTAASADDVAYALYLAEYEELWARSYAQYVIVASGDPRLLRQLDSVRQHPSRPGAGYTPEQWDDGDFAPIAAAIDAVFRGLGWTR